MVNFPGGFPGGGPGGFPGGFPGGRPGGFPGGFPGGGPGGFPGGFPGGGPGGFPGGFPGGGPGSNQGGQVNPPPPSQQMIARYQYLNQNPAQAQSMLQPQGVTTYAVGCDGRWTIVLLRNGQLLLMYVISANVSGNTTGIIWPNFTFASFPSSAILAYSCN
ncbi:hypothetical protein [Lysinibacillus sp. 54212]|uniref:hypothetical protein n=1 Tax=Lysinibacillus sp. 54212 TaxID=3119829 RepID=UPI002FCA6344